MAEQTVAPGTGGVGGGGSSGSRNEPIASGVRTPFAESGLPGGLQSWGLPPEVAAAVQRMLQQGYSIDEILGYIRGTDWYAQTYPGIQQGIALGLISNEADYRAYLNQANQLYRRYYGRDITSQEMSGFLMSGVNLSAINEQLQTGALFKTMFGDPIPPEELTSILGSGISADSYLQIQASYRQLFGRDANPGEISLFLRSGASPGDLQAYNEIFRRYTGQGVDPETLAGLLASGTSAQTVAQEFQTKGDVTQLYRQYGQRAPAGTVQDILAGRTSLNEISQHLEGQAYIGAYGGDIAGTFKAYGAGERIGSAELKALGDQKAGYTTPLGYKLQRAMEQAVKRMEGVFHGSVATTAGIGLGRLGLSAPQNSSPPDRGA